MRVINGIAASKGIAVGHVFYKVPQKKDFPSKKVKDPALEWVRFVNAKALSLVQLDELYYSARKKIGGEDSLIFSVQKMMLADNTLIGNIERSIKTDGHSAEYSVVTAAEEVAGIFLGLEEEYFKQRASDINDICERLIANLSGGSHDFSFISTPIILMAEDFLPSDTMLLDKSMVLAFVSERGGKMSHAAILARTIARPAIVGVGKLAEKIHGEYAIVDGDNGIMIIDPDEETVKRYFELSSKMKVKTQALKALRDVKTVTKDGIHIPIYANIGSVNDLVYVKENGAEGVGLFRTEFLFMENNEFPTEEQQFLAFKQVLSETAPAKVIIRTTDIGSDKSVPFFPVENEQNPALGFRAIRICLERIEEFKIQLRALYRASIYGNLGIMIPLIVNENELDCVIKLCDVVKKELLDERIPFSNDVMFGIMIETPAAAMISDKLAKKVDFFSIGTNDLTQYALAVDRTNAKVSYLYNTSDLGLLRLIKLAIDNAHEAGIKVSICGESASDISLADMYISLGIDSLSVSPSSVLELREHILNTDFRTIKGMYAERLL